MNGRHPLGTVARLWRYPVKGLCPESLACATIDPEGIVGDRRRVLFVTSTDHARSGRTYRGKENALLHTRATVDDARRLAAQRNVDLSARDDGPYFDAEPVSIVFDSWVRELEQLIAMPLDPQRFRPNFYVRAAAGFAADESSLIGRIIAVGDARLEVVSAIERCVVITNDVRTGDATPLVQRAL
ncbi:MAG: MOSC domain-containing protein, partial [Candidatus Eremiobacteraeota bacterium]|nr:MOSC domain-containing protein [Candidatus Eremiobacteraeota bacterium]